MAPALTLRLQALTGERSCVGVSEVSYVYVYPAFFGHFNVVNNVICILYNVYIISVHNAHCVTC